MKEDVLSQSCVLGHDLAEGNTLEPVSTPPVCHSPQRGQADESPDIKLDADSVENFRCLNCGDKLRHHDQVFQCDSCESRYPIADGVPILIASHKSLFDISY